jgi:hypothetical protein
MRDLLPFHFPGFPATFFVARPSRWQLVRARLWLLFFARRPTPISDWMQLGLALLAGAEFLLGVTLPSVALSLSGEGRFALGLFGLVAAGGAVLLARWRARGDLEDEERDGGSLVGLGPSQFVWTERGSTLVCGWDLVTTHESPFGLIFELPWRRVCLLPYEALETPASP